MRSKFKHIYISASILLIFSQCSDSTEFKIDSEFNFYLEKFIQLAAAHSLTLNPQASGLIIEFADLPAGTAGLTHHEKPVRIEIDRTYWNSLKTYTNAEQMREELLFHELGHALLNRRHNNSLLSNGEWKSIMCGGDVVDTKSWNIHYFGKRINYYTDELFQSETAEPEICSPLFVPDTSGYNINFALNFDTTVKTDFGWALTSNPSYSIEQESGKMKYTSHDSVTRMLLLKTNQSSQSDFCFSIEIQQQAGKSTNKYGLVFGNYSSISASAMEYFLIADNAHFYPGNKAFYSYYSEISCSAIRNDKNKLTVYKRGNMLSYFINNEYCFCTEPGYSDEGFYFGLLLPAGAILTVDNFQLGLRASGAVAANIRHQQVFDSFCVATKNNNSIFKH